MLSFINNKGDCTGCSACFSVCPVHCIKMDFDCEGFLYPTASDECIHCNQCEKICPISNPKKLISDKNITQTAYAAVSKSQSVWQRSASGGAFSEICRSWSDEGTLIVGAAFDGLSVHQICVYGFDKIAPLCKSKYVASNPENTFTEIRDHLLKGKKAIFCGTPCQVAGLRSFLNYEYNNLLLIDLICHGVGSTSVFNSCIDCMEKDYSKEIISYEFRSKRRYYEEDHLNRITFSDRAEKYLVNDRYMQLFLKQNCLRPSCGKNCKYRTVNRQGDITIADFKGLTDIFPNLRGTNKNYSSIIFNTVKGSNLVEPLKAKMNMYLCSLESIKAYNPLFFRQTQPSAERDEFFAEYCKAPQRAVLSFTVKSTERKQNPKRILYNLMPIGIRKIAIKIWRSIRHEK